MKSSKLILCYLLIVTIVFLTGCSYSDSINNEDYLPPVINYEEGDGAAEEERFTELVANQREEDATHDLGTKDEELEGQEFLTGEFDDNKDDVTLFDISLVPAFSGTPYVVLNNNQPLFEEDEKTTIAFEIYSKRDELNRCGMAYANICQDLMPTETRGPIGSIKPSGWHTVKYNDLIDGNYLYNRCHLIGYQLAGENANEDNLITGTRFLNIQGMLPFENMVIGYVEETGNHVLYRVTPIFEKENLVASGVTIEGLSVEDNGEGICFYVFAYNVQPGIIIDYLTGDSWRDTEYSTGEEAESLDRNNVDGEDKEENPSIDSNINSDGIYVLNTNTHKFHIPTCGSVSDMKEKNKRISSDSRDDIINQGYVPCKRCNP